MRSASNPKRKSTSAAYQFDLCFDGLIGTSSHPPTPKLAQEHNERGGRAAPFLHKANRNPNIWSALTPCLYRFMYLSERRYGGFRKSRIMVLGATRAQCRGNLETTARRRIARTRTWRVCYLKNPQTKMKGHPKEHKSFGRGAQSCAIRAFNPLRVRRASPHPALDRSHLARRNRWGPARLGLGTLRFSVYRHGSGLV
jgi:hypothetical protein